MYGKKSSNEGYYRVDYYSAMNMMAVMQVKDEFNEQKEDYEEFREMLTDGQQILDNFKNKSEN